MIEEQWDIKGKLTKERRFFISNLAPKAQRIAGAVRSPWRVENNLHWTLDVVFNEDSSRAPKELPSLFPSPQTWGEGARRADEGLLLQRSLLMFTTKWLGYS